RHYPNWTAVNSGMPPHNYCSASTAAAKPPERGVPGIRFLGFRVFPIKDSLSTGPLVQRLFSTFPEGWPGTGLVFLRAVAAIPAIQHSIAGLVTAPLPSLAILQLVAVGAAALLLIGFWTPVAGVLLALAELCLAFSLGADPWMH